MQSPDAFFRRVCLEEKIELPEKGRYAGGLVFLPTDEDHRRTCRSRFETLVHKQGQQLLGWRKVPVNSEALGHLSRNAQPDIYHIFIGCGTDIRKPSDFERKLYVIRKQMEHDMRALDL
jgi:glutamate synthase domain-containing protein 1